MLLVDLNDIFSCQEYNSLLCNCSVRGCRETTMRKTTCRVCDVTSSPFLTAIHIADQSPQVRVYFLQGGSGKLVNIHEGTHPSLAGTWLAGTLSEGL